MVLIKSSMAPNRSICVILILFATSITAQQSTYNEIVLERNQNFSDSIHAVNDSIIQNSNLFWFDCNYDSIESNYFQLNETFLLPHGGSIQYCCTSIVDVRNCTSNNIIEQHNPYAADTKLIPLNCQDVMIKIQPPDSLTLLPDAMTYVQENAQKMPLVPGFDKYVAWINISNISNLHEGQYSIEFNVGRQQLYRHSITLSTINDTGLIEMDLYYRSKPADETFLSKFSFWNSVEFFGLLCGIFLLIISMFVLCKIKARKYFDIYRLDSLIAI